MGLSSLTFKQQGQEHATWSENCEIKARHGRSRSFKVIETGVSLKPVYDFLLAASSNLSCIAIVSEILRWKDQKSAFYALFIHARLIGMSRRGCSSESYRVKIGTKNLNLCATRCVNHVILLSFQSISELISKLLHLRTSQLLLVSPLISLTPHQPQWSLRSVNQNLLSVPRCKDKEVFPTVPLKSGMTYHFRSDSPLHSTALSAT